VAAVMIKIKYPKTWKLNFYKKKCYCARERLSTIQEVLTIIQNKLMGTFSE